MNNEEFEQFVLKFGKDILRFCRMTAKDTESGDDLYQDTMLKLLEKKKRLDSGQNAKSYALSTSIYLWKNKKKKYANRMTLVPIDSMDEMSDEGYEISNHDNEASPEHVVLQQNEIEMVQGLVASLPEKYRMPIYLYYSADMQINEISQILGLPEGTVKSRMRTANIPKHYTGVNVADNRTAAGFYIGGTWSVDGNSSEQLQNTFEGEVIDSHTFAGMLKMNLDEKASGSGELRLNVNGLGYDDDRMLDSEEISASHWTDGNWSMVLPFEVNETGVKTIEVGEKNGDIELNDVVVSPYQVIVHTTTPGKQRELTDDRREKLLSKDPDMTDEEMLELLGWSYVPCQTIVFNQDGELLYSDAEMAGRAGFAVQGKEIEALNIFIFDNLDDWEQMASEGMNSSAAERAVIAKEILVD